MAEELETVLRLVAEGKLTPEEAAPIIEALTRAEQRSHDDHWGAGFDHAFERGFGNLDRLGERIDRKVNRRIERAQRRVERRVEAARARVADAAEELGRVSRGRQLRIKVTERGRQVVNLRIPIGFVDTALTFVPGLGGDQAERIREAVRAGAIGPILDVEDPDGQGGVLISVE